jgi:hypothetical protein
MDAPPSLVDFFVGPDNKYPIFDSTAVASNYFILQQFPVIIEMISISGFGGGNDTVRHLKLTHLRVLTDDGSSMQMKVLIVPDIASAMRTHST